jgi:hypothetical protein
VYCVGLNTVDRGRQLLFGFQVFPNAPGFAVSHNRFRALIRGVGFSPDGPSVHHLRLRQNRPGAPAASRLPGMLMSGLVGSGAVHTVLSGRPLVVKRPRLHISIVQKTSAGTNRTYRYKSDVPQGILFGGQTPPALYMYIIIDGKIDRERQLLLGFQVHT